MGLLEPEGFTEDGFFNDWGPVRISRIDANSWTCTKAPEAIPPVGSATRSAAARQAFPQTRIARDVRHRPRSSRGVLVIGETFFASRNAVVNPRRRFLSPPSASALGMTRMSRTRVLVTMARLRRMLSRIPPRSLTITSLCLKENVVPFPSCLTPRRMGRDPAIPLRPTPKVLLLHPSTPLAFLLPSLRLFARNCSLPRLLSVGTFAHAECLSQPFTSLTPGWSQILFGLALGLLLSPTMPSLRSMPVVMYLRRSASPRAVRLTVTSMKPLKLLGFLHPPPM
ncbi:hypothetical protein BKA56DRAFT_213577 [Ilyonectria sp. MPI-CAGE-AT-0026]|nr:hypothetical protein BKA56DRAFT_213577 [Ilyonectria sp. MPI-CAGE-AT-0026]